MAYSDYLKKISKSGEWGDHVTLQAATDKFGCKIFVITSFKDTCYIEILPRDQKPNRVLFLSFWAEVHYNSIHPEGGFRNNMSSNRSSLLAKEAKTSYIWIQIKNGLIQQVEEELSAVCPIIHREMSGTGKGSSKNNPIHLPEEVSPAMLSLILQYWKFHLIPGHSDKERRSFDEKFVKTNTDDLLELALAAHALQLRPLVDLTSGALARRIGGCSNDEIRKIFHVPDDLTEEEKLKHLKNPTNDPFIRLLNQSLARKRKKWKEQNELKNIDLLNKQEDTRPIEDLLEFINGKDKERIVNPSKKGLLTSPMQENHEEE